MLKGATLPAFRTPGAHGPKTPCRTPIFLDFGPARRDRAPTAPGSRPFCEPTTLRSVSDFGLPPAWVLSTISAESPLTCRIGASQPRNVVGKGLGWVEHSHTESPGITPAAAPIFSTQPPVMLSACSGPAGQKATQPAPRRAAHGQKGFAGPFHTKLRRAHDFGGHVP